MIEMKLEEFNSLPPKEAWDQLFKCCGCTHWANNVVEHMPFKSIESLKEISDNTWWDCRKADWLEAFSHHPKIGQKALEKKFEATKSWAENEQSGTQNDNENILQELVKANNTYENKFGFIFIVCATGKTAGEMLELLNERLNNDVEKELNIAAQEQNKITHLRFDKLIS